MKTMRMLVRGLLATTLFACGGGMDKTELALPEGDDVQMAELVDSVQYENLNVSFYAAYFPGQDDPAIIVTQNMEGAQTQNLYDRLMQGTGSMISTAELWKFVTNEDDVPPVLQRDHELQTARWGRSDDFIQASATPAAEVVSHNLGKHENLDFLPTDGTSEVEKATQAQMNFDPFNTNIFGVPPAGKCWDGLRSAARDNSNGLGWHSCSFIPRHQASLTEYVYLGTGVNFGACNAGFDEPGWNRTTITNLSTGTQGHADQTAQYCWGSGNSSWRCLDKIAVPVGFNTDLNSPTAFRASYTVQNPTITPSATNDRYDSWSSGYLFDGATLTTGAFAGRVCKALH